MNSNGLYPDLTEFKIMYGFYDEADCYIKKNGPELQSCRPETPSQVPSTVMQCYVPYLAHILAAGLIADNSLKVNTLSLLSKPMYKSGVLSVQPYRKSSYFIQKGFILAINNINFHNVFHPRHGALEDLEETIEFFRSTCCVNVAKHHDLTRDRMKTVIESALMNKDFAEKYDAFFLLVSSHGNEAGVQGVDGETLSIDEISAMFSSKSCLFPIHKPKVFIMQACRGLLSDDGKTQFVGRGTMERDNGKIVLPSDSNILKILSTTHGRTAHSYVYGPYSRQGIGSWFLSSLVQVFKANMHDMDILSMCTIVNKCVSNYGDDAENGPVKQISSQDSTLTYSLYLTSKIF